MENTNQTIVEIQKVKPREVGKKGECILNFDLEQLRFYELNDLNERKYSEGQTEKNPNNLPF